MTKTFTSLIHPLATGNVGSAKQNYTANTFFSSQRIYTTIDNQSSMIYVSKGNEISNTYISWEMHVDGN